MTSPIDAHIQRIANSDLTVAWADHFQADGAHDVPAEDGAAFEAGWWARCTGGDRPADAIGGVAYDAAAAKGWPLAAD